jgi:small subunit ribosomal protein S16
LQFIDDLKLLRSFEMVRIRLAKGGRNKRPIFTIVAADMRSPRDGRFLEKLGQYNPNSTELLKQVNVEAIAKWMKNGACMSDTVKSLLKKQKIQINL